LWTTLYSIGKVGGVPRDKVCHHSSLNNRALTKFKAGVVLLMRMELSGDQEGGFVGLLSSLNRNGIKEKMWWGGERGL